MTNEPSVDKPAPAVEVAQVSKLAVEFGPLAVFFLSNAYQGIFWATGAFMVATVVALVLSRVLFGRIPIMPLISGVVVMGFGGLTLLLHDDTFIKMKPTFINALFATVLLGGLAMGHSLLKYLFGEVFSLREPGWRILTFRWACFFVVLAILNEIIWRTTSTDFWVSFKVFGIMPLTMVFAIAQVGVLKRYENRSEA